MRPLEETVRRVFPLDSASEEEWQTRLAAQGKTGRLATLAARLAGIYRETIHPHKPLLAIFTAAHGIAAKRPLPKPPLSEPPSLAMGPLPAMTTVLADMGGNDALCPANINRVSRPVAAASGDICRGPAMSIATARQAVETGISLAEEWRNFDLFAITCRSDGSLYAASAIAARCLGEYKESDLPASAEAALVAEILSAACDGKTGLELLAALGGFDLGGAAGLMLALAADGRPIVLTDFAATAAAMIAARLEPFIRDYLFATAAECPLHQAALALLGAPVLSEPTAEQAITTLITASSLFIEAGRA